MNAMKMKNILSLNQSEPPFAARHWAPFMVIAGSDFFMEDCHMPKTHGLSRENGKNRKLYKVWSQMKNRCSNPRATRFKYYGAMGVKVCKEWFDFPVFYEWAINNCYMVGLTIDRKDPNGNYEPNNCRWVTPQVQSLNRRPKKGRGVSWDKRRNKWRGRVWLKGKEIHSHYFKKYEDAVLFVETEKEKIKLIVDKDYPKMEVTQ